MLSAVSFHLSAPGRGLHAGWAAPCMANQSACSRRFSSFLQPVSSPPTVPGGPTLPHLTTLKNLVPGPSLCLPQRPAARTKPSAMIRALASCSQHVSGTRIPQD